MGRHTKHTNSTIAEAMAAAPSVTAAARTLGVNRSTVHRWRKSGRLPEAGPRPRVADTPAPVASASADFAADLRARFNFTRSEDELVTLAQSALDIAHDQTASPTTRLAAMAQFRAALRDLKLPVEVPDGDR